MIKRKLLLIHLGLLLFLTFPLQLGFAQDYIIISEIMYDTPLNEQIATGVAYSNGEYIELYNPGFNSVKLNGWYLKGGGSTEVFYFPSNTILPSKSYLIVAYRYSNSGFLLDRLYENFMITGNNQVIYQRKIILSNSGEPVKLYDRRGNMKDSIYIDGTINKNKTDRLSADNIDNRPGNLCVSLQRKTAVFDNNGNAISNNSEWQTALVTLNKPFLEFTEPQMNNNDGDSGENTSGGNTGEGSSDPNNPDNNLPTIPVSNIVKLNDSSFTKPVIWFKTSRTDDNSSYFWKDFSGNKMRLSKLQSIPDTNRIEFTVPDSSINYFNFNPALKISHTQVVKEISNLKSNLEQSTIMGVWSPNEENNIEENANLFALKNIHNNNILFTKKQVAQSQLSEKLSLEYGISNSKNLLFQPTKETEQNFLEKSLRIATYQRSNKANNSIWGEPKCSNLYLSGNVASFQENDSSDFHSSFSTFEGFQGYVPELLVFDKMLISTENKIYQTYLAIKYGLSLDTDYLSAERKLMWDYEKNNAYKYRITGYGRQDTLRLYQKFSSTSYEEAPYFSYTKDSTHNRYDDIRTTPKIKLLSMGCEPGSILKNNEYVLFGDNDAPLTIDENNNSNSFKMIQRRWLLKTNIPWSPFAKLNWKNNNVNIIEKNDNLLAIEKNDSVSIGNCNTLTTLDSKDGYLSWRFGEKQGSTILLLSNKPDSVSSDSIEYGYKFDEDGKVFNIHRGKIDKNSFIQIQQNDRLEIEKNDNRIYLKINGYNVKESELQITNLVDLEAAYYCRILFEGSGKIRLNEFRHGGFVDTGHRAELSYFSERASSLTNYKEYAYLIIDQTGENDFSSQNIRTYPVTEIDTIRNKIIFNNIVWDKIGTEKIFFTFGYKLPPPSQQIKGDKSKNDSTIHQVLNVDNSFISVYYKDLKELSKITVRVFLNNGEPYNIFIYDVSGKIIYKEHFLGSVHEHFTDIQLPYSGFFVIKVISATHNINTKLISK